MSKGNACFYCRNSGESEPAHPDGVGWIHSCKFGIDNTGFDEIDTIAEQCGKYSPRFGFQMGGYYTHMWFEPESCEPEDDCMGICLEWCIQGDLEFPTEEKTIKIHICDFTQIERWVEFWGEELRKRRLVE